MNKTKKEEIKNMKDGQIIVFFYDKENMRVYNVEDLQINYDNYFPSEPTRSYDLSSVIMPRIIAQSFEFSTDFNEVELDPTTMQRIAKYNKETNIKKLDKEIEEKQNYLNELKKDINSYEEKLKQANEFLSTFFKSGKDMDSYLEDLKYDYDDNEF